MNYNSRIASISDFSMKAIIENCKRNIPANYRNKPYFHPDLNHGIDLLQSEVGLDCYIGAYGEMHQAKCRAALQNLPFPPQDSDVPSWSLEIVDWGCGQGIGTICLIDYLKDRDLAHWLRKVTLIEPSKAALDRAVVNTSKATCNSVQIVPINEYLPTCSDTNEISGINYEMPVVIHLFSNILDVDGIDLVKVAKCIETPGHYHYVVCIGPLNANAFRMERFCEIFQPESFFTNISDRNYNRTSDTNYIYTCKTKGFIYKGTTLNLSAYNPLELASSPVYKEYDVNLHMSNGLMSNGKAWVYYRLQNILSQEDLIYINPDINGTSPDFVIVRPKIGIIVVSVFEENIDNCSRHPDENNTKSLIVKDTDAEGMPREREIQMPHLTLDISQDLIIESLKELTEAVIANSYNLGLVKKVLICTTGNKDKVEALLGKQIYTSIYGREFIQNEDVSRNFFREIKAIYNNTDFDEIVVNKLKQLLSPDWHSYREGTFINLTSVQNNLAKSVAGAQQKISGVAGSGKTQVLATRAVNAQKRTGGDVLLLTYNITLINYMRMRLHQVRADFPWSKIHIDHYHRFFRKIANLNNLKVALSSYNEVDYFENALRSLPKYDAIFIDEVQDYDSNWLQILKRYFLKGGGEFVVFGDPKQNIYHRELDTEGNILLGIIPGLWNKSLTKSHRFGNPAIASLAMSFQKLFLDKEEQIAVTESNETHEIQFNLMEYHRCQPSGPSENDIESIYSICKNFIENNRLNHGEVVILATKTDILRELDYNYRQDFGRDTTISFVNKEEYQNLSRSSNQATYAFERDCRRLEKVKKNRFTIMTHNLKLSTIQSFKGWESPTVICIIQNGCDSDDNLFTSPELVYTGITRTKTNLLVINIGNNKYHEFFNSHLQ